MSNDHHIFLTHVDIIDEVFTEEVADEWKKHLLNSYEDVYNSMKAIIDPVSPIKFFASKSLIEETILDTIIGLKKVTGSSVHEVRFPNAFKIAAYLAYWWLRHKPISLHYPKEFFLEDVVIKPEENQSKAEAEVERKKTIWRLKHINELIAVQMVMTYIFRFDETVCNTSQCGVIKEMSDDGFVFKDFDSMKTVILHKLTYYFSYRPIAPKIIEHILEGYTFHPAWKLTGKLWSTEDAQV